MEKLVVILDDMPEYAERLAVYLNGRRSFPYRTVVFSAPEEIKGYVENGAVHAVLAAACFEKEVLEMVIKTDIRVFLFSETKEVRDGLFLYRYRSAKEIEKRLTEPGKTERKLRVFGVYSPGGGVWLERLGREIAKRLAGGENVLYLPFVPFGMFGREHGDGLSELLFYIKQREEVLTERFEKLLQTGEEAHCIGPVRWSTELREIAKEDIESLLRFLETKTEYDSVILAVGWLDAAGSTVLRSCDAVLTPVWETEEGRRLQAEFLRQLKEAGEAELLSRVVEFPLTDGGEGVGFSQAVTEAVKRGKEALCGYPRDTSEPDLGAVESIGRINR